MDNIVKGTLAASAVTALNLLSALPTRRKLSILIFHQVVSVFDPMRPSEVTAAEFEWQLALVKRYFTPLGLLEAVNLLKQRRLPRNAICLTFDDGYADNEQIALPLLKKWGIPASFFVATGFTGGGRMWNDTIIESVRGVTTSHIDITSLKMGHYTTRTTEEKYHTACSIITKLKHLPLDQRQQLSEEIAKALGGSLPDDLMMDKAQIRHLHSSGMEVGGHTVNHPILATLRPADAEQEIGRNKEELEAICGGPLASFAFPNGKPTVDYLPEHVNMVKKCGYQCAVATSWGVSAYDADLWQLNRFTPWDRQTHGFLLRMLRNYLS